ncbi:hypothetical protein HK096_007334 [Nowakowskiella sp. JEL0078]|nr:hypothetical protein HK096_007334 [Nowakowskiella sp. JEL0078]
MEIADVNSKASRIAACRWLDSLSRLLTNWSETHSHCKSYWEDLARLNRERKSALVAHSKSFLSPLAGSFVSSVFSRYDLDLDSPELVLDPSNSLSPLLPFIPVPTHKTGFSLISMAECAAINNVPDLIPPLDFNTRIQTKTPSSISNLPKNNEIGLIQPPKSSFNANLLTYSQLVAALSDEIELKIQSLLVLFSPDFSQMNQSPSKSQQSPEEIRSFHAIVRDMNSLRRDVIAKSSGIPFEQPGIPGTIHPIEAADWIDTLVLTYDKEASILEAVIRNLNFSEDQDVNGSNGSFYTSYKRWKEGGNLEWEYEQEIWERFNLLINENFKKSLPNPLIRYQIAVIATPESKKHITEDNQKVKSAEQQINKSPFHPREHHNFLDHALAYKSFAKNLKNTLKYQGPYSVAQYMRHCLTHPINGYYMERDVFGTKGDFITAPEISQLFGEVYTFWIWV